jgi:phospholipid/cholesterol/gamma-HCH transport system substrate-binding protein
MTIARNEIRTGLLVIVTVATMVGTLIYLGSPGVFVPQKTFDIFFDNASGLEPGAPVLLAGRRIGRVTTLHSPVPEKDRPDPKLETLVEIEVEKSARIFKKVKARMALPSLLGKPVIDFTSGEEDSGLAEDGAIFVGERTPGLAEAVPTILEKLDPVLAKVTETLDGLKKTADNLSNVTKEGSDLPVALAEFRKFGTHLNELSGPDSSLRHSLQNIEKLTGNEGKLAKSLDHIHDLTGPDGDLAKAMANARAITGPDSDLAKTMTNAKDFTGKLAENKDIDATLKNLREVSENLNAKIDGVMDELHATGANLKQGSDTLKRQPWRLIWPTTKKYPEEEQRVAERGTDESGGKRETDKRDAVRETSDRDADAKETSEKKHGLRAFFHRK